MAKEKGKDSNRSELPNAGLYTLTSPLLVASLLDLLRLMVDKKFSPNPAPPLILVLPLLPPPPVLPELPGPLLPVPQVLVVLVYVQSTCLEQLVPVHGRGSIIHGSREDRGDLREGGEGGGGGWEG